MSCLEQSRTCLFWLLHTNCLDNWPFRICHTSDRSWSRSSRSHRGLYEILCKISRCYRSHPGNVYNKCRSYRSHQDRHVPDHADPKDPKQKECSRSRGPYRSHPANCVSNNRLVKISPGGMCVKEPCRIDPPRANVCQRDMVTQTPFGQTCMQELSLYHVAHKRDTLRTRAAPHRSQGRSTCVLSYCSR